MSGKFIILFAILAFCATLGLSHPPNKCPRNEVWTNCANQCLEHCPCILRYVRCSTACQPGCKCREGWTRNQSGTCIPKEECETC